MMGGDEAMETYEICMGANLTCMNDLMNRMGESKCHHNDVISCHEIDSKCHTNYGTYKICMGANLTCMNDLMNPMGESKRQ